MHNKTKRGDSKGEKERAEREGEKGKECAYINCAITRHTFCSLLSPHWDRIKWNEIVTIIVIMRGKNSGKTDRKYNTRFSASFSLSFVHSFHLICLPFARLFLLTYVLPVRIAATGPPPPFPSLAFGSDLLQPCATAWKMFQVHFYECSLILWQEAVASGSRRRRRRRKRICCASSNFK